MGKNLVTGHFSDLMKIGTPAYIHSSQSYLNMISKDLCFHEHFINDGDSGEKMLDDLRVMHGDASGDIITTVAQRCHEVSL